MPCNRPSTGTTMNCKNYFKWRECGTFCTLRIKFLVTILTWRSANLYINIAQQNGLPFEGYTQVTYGKKKSIEIYNNQTDLHRSLVGWIGEVIFNWKLNNLQLVTNCHNKWNSVVKSAILMKNSECNIICNVFTAIFYSVCSLSNIIQGVRNSLNPHRIGKKNMFI